MMISLEDIAKWGAVAATGATVVTTVTLFIFYRADYIRAGHPEPTLLAVRLTQSTLKNWARLRRGEKVAPSGHARRGDAEPHHHRRQTDFGTVNRPIDGFEGLKEAIHARKTPHPSSHRKSDDTPTSE